MMKNVEREYSGTCEEYFDYIRKVFQYLLEDHGYEWEWNNEKPLAFDNCALILQSDLCAFHILRNRGFTEIEVSTPAYARIMNKRHSLYAMMKEYSISHDNWITYDDIRTDEDELKQLDHYANIIRNNLKEIERAITTFKV